MSTTIRRNDFVNRFRENSVSVDTVNRNSNVNSNTKSATRRADLDGDGRISGSREGERLFQNLDHYDRDGSRNSLKSNSSIRTMMGLVQGSTPQRTTIRRDAFQQSLEGKEIGVREMTMRPELSLEAKERTSRADLNGDGFIRGREESNRLFDALDHFDRNGDRDSMLRTPSIDAVLDTARTSTVQPNEPAPPTNPRQGIQGNFTYQHNAAGVQRAARTDLGRKVPTEMTKHLDTYKRASELTGVPADLIAAIHGNESQFGTYRTSTRGPESGFGLDPRYVTTSWGNDKLSQHGLGSWRRGQTGDTAVLQSAVIAAEHLKRQANYAGIRIKQNMSQGELAGAVTSYVQGPGAGRSANRRGNSWLFRPTDANPHPYHPGGTSVGRGGRIIRVAPSRKDGLLRWDTLLPLIRQHMW